MIHPKPLKPETHAYDGDLFFWQKDNDAFLLHIQQDSNPYDPRRDCDNPNTMFCVHRRYDLGDRLPEQSIGGFWADLIKDNVPEAVIVQRLKDGIYPEYKYEEQYAWTHSDSPGDAEILEDFWEEIREEENMPLAVRIIQDYAIALPLWLYDHSGLTISCGGRSYPFNDPWDSSAIGWIITTKKQALENLTEQETNPDGTPGEYKPCTEANWAAAAVKAMQTDVELYDQYLTGDTYRYTLYHRVLKPEDDPEAETTEEDWGIREDCGCFFGSEIFKSGLAENVGSGFLDALKSGDYQTGKAEPFVIHHVRFRKR